LLIHLKTDWLDCYLLHWRGPHPLEDTFAAFDVLRADGKILSYGVSNFDVPDRSLIAKHPFLDPCGHDARAGSGGISNLP
jgi:diketogulonate reductase-like aldo/keto reductase